MHKCIANRRLKFIALMIGLLFLSSEADAAYLGGDESLWLSNSSSIYYNLGNVGLGNSNPSAKLHINGATDVEGLRIITSNYSPFVIRNATDTADLFRIDQNGNITSLGSLQGSNTYWNLNGSNLFASSTAWKIGIGTTNPGTKFSIIASDDKDNGPITNMSGFIPNQYESGRIRFTETDINSSPFYQGGFIHYNGQGNTLNIGVHETVDSATSSDVNAISIIRSTGNVGINVSPGARLDINGSFRTNNSNTFSLLAGGGNRVASVDNSGVLGGSNIYLHNNNVGVGVTDPFNKFEAAGSSTPVFEAAGYYNTYAYGDSTKAESRINLGKIESGTRQPMGAIGAFPTSNVDSNNGALVFYTRQTQSLNERIRILSGGNVGIGTTNPLAKLDIAYQGVFNTTTPGLSSYYGLHFSGQTTADNATGITWNGGSNGAQAGLYVQGSGAYGTKMYFATTNAYATGAITRMIIDHAGNTGINTTTPDAKLQVNGSFHVSGALNSVVLDRLTGTGNRIVMTDASGSLFATSSSIASGLPSASGLSGYTLRSDGANWTANNVLYNNGSNISIGTTTSSAKLTVSGGHGNSLMRLVASGFGQPAASNDAILTFWASEPGTSYTGVGIGNNVINYGTTAFERINTARGASYMRLSDNSIALYTLDATGTRATNMTMSGGNVNLSYGTVTFPSGAWNSSGNIGIGTPYPAGRLNLVRAAADNLLYADTYSTNAGHTNYWFSRRSHNDTAGTITPTLSGDYEGVFYFQGVNASSSFAYGAEMVAQQIGLAGVYVPTDLRLNTYSSTSKNSNQLVLSNNGNVGIATSNPSAKLYVNGTSIFNDVATFTQPVIVASPILGPHAATKSYVDSTLANATSSITLWGGTAGANIWSLNSGNVGIGTTSPAAKLEINNTNTSSKIVRINMPAGQTGHAIFLADSTGAEKFSVLANGNVVTMANFIGYGFIDPGTNKQGWMVDSTKAYVRTDAVTRMTIDSIGNVGIGTTNPNDKLEVMGGNVSVAINQWFGTRFNGQATFRPMLGFDSTNVILRGIASGDGIDFQSSVGTSLMHIKESGNVGVSTTSPAARLAVVGGNIFIHDATITSGTPKAAVTKEYLDSAIAGIVLPTVPPALWNLSGSNLYASSTSWNVGIGTASPGSKLEVQGNTLSLTLPALGTSKGTIHVNPAGTNDNFSAITFGGSANGSTVNSAQAGIYAQGSAIYGMKMYFATTDVFANGAQARMTIDQAGNVAIGTTSPASKLHVYNGDISMEPGYKIGWDSGTEYIRRTVGADGFAIGTQGTDKLVINTLGNVGIGNSNPGSILAIQTTNPNEIYLKANTSGSSNYISTMITAESNIDYRGRGLFLPTTDAAASSAWFAGVPYTGGGFIIGNSSTHTNQNANGPYIYANAKLSVFASGNISIGTTTANSRLGVSGGNIVINDAAITSGTPKAAVTKEYLDSAIAGIVLPTVPEALWNLSGSNLYASSTSWNVGIGTTSPAYKLHLAGGDFRSEGTFRTGNSGEPGRWRFYDTSGYLMSFWVPGTDYDTWGQYWDTSDNELRWMGSGNMKSSIDLDDGSAYFQGSVGIGTSTPEYKLDVMGNAIFRVGTASVNILNPGVGYTGIFYDKIYNSSGFNLTYWTGTAEASGIRLLGPSGNVGLSTTSPASRLAVVGGNVFIHDAAITSATPKAAVTKEYLDSAIAGISIPTVPPSLWTLSGSNLYASSSSWSVGIGTAAPIDKLSVIGAISAGYVDQANYPRIRGSMTHSGNPNGLTIISQGANASTGGSGDIRFVTSDSNSANGSTDAPVSEKLRIRYNGNVGIGTSTPTEKLSVIGNIGISPSSLIGSGVGYAGGGGSSSSATLQLYNSSNGNTVLNNQTYSIRMQTAGTDRLTILNNGNIGVGTSTPETKLDVEGIAKINGGSSSNWASLNIGGSMSINTQGSIYSYNSMCISNASGSCNGAGGIVLGLGNSSAVTNFPNSGNSFVNNGGGFGVGTSTPSAKIAVVGGNIFIHDAAITSGTPKAAVTKEYIDSALGALGGSDYWKFTGTDKLYASSTDWKVGIGTTNPGTTLTLGNNKWISAVDGAGTGYANMFRVNAANQIEIGSPLLIGPLELTQDGGALTFIDMPVTAAAAAGTVESYTMKIDGNNLLSLYSTSNGTGGVNNLRVGIGTTNPSSSLHVVGNATISTGLTMGGDINLGGNNITNINKLTVNTIDPLYRIKGSNYSTYASAIVGGVNEEYVGRVKISRLAGSEYEAVIRLDALKEGSDLWVWRKVVDFSPENVQALITPYGSFARVYYKIDGENLIFRSDRPAEISYRLIGKRHDWRQWPTRSNDQKEKPGFIID